MLLELQVEYQQASKHLTYQTVLASWEQPSMRNFIDTITAFREGDILPFFGWVTTS